MKALSLKFILVLLLSFEKNYAKDSYSFGSKELVKIIEFNQMQNTGRSTGSQNMSALLGNMRLVNNLNANSTELYKDDITKSEGSSAFRLRYSHEFTEMFYWSIYLMANQKVTFNQRSIGDKGSTINDSTQLNQSIYGLKLGFGPLDYFADFSLEASIGIESTRESGPFNSQAFRFPGSENGRVSPGSFFLGNGDISFHTNSWSMSFGISMGEDFLGPIGRYIAIYSTAEFLLVTGNMKLNTFGIYPQSPIRSLETDLLTNTDLQFGSLRFKNVFGFNWFSELGLVFKFTDQIGFRVGGFMQIPLLNFEGANGYYYDKGQFNEVQSSSILRQSYKDTITILGWSFGLVTRF
jgi:hypothetical protein